MLKRTPKCWRQLNSWDPDAFVWNGDLHGPSCAARLKWPKDVVVASVRGDELIFNSTAEAQAYFSNKGPPDVCLDEPLAVALGSPLFYDENCTLDDISWHALKTGIASPFSTAKVLRLLTTARRCRVRLRKILAGRKPHAG